MQWYLKTISNMIWQKRKKKKKPESANWRPTKSGTDTQGAIFMSGDMTH